MQQINNEIHLNEQAKIEIIKNEIKDIKINA